MNLPEINLILLRALNQFQDVELESFHSHIDNILTEKEEEGKDEEDEDEEEEDEEEEDEDEEEEDEEEEDEEEEDEEEEDEDEEEEDEEDEDKKSKKCKNEKNEQLNIFDASNDKLLESSDKEFVNFFNKLIAEDK